MKAKTGAALLMMAAVLLFTSCGTDTSWVAKSQEDTMPAGVYIAEQIDSVYEVVDRYIELNPDAEQPEALEDQAELALKAHIDGKTGEELVNELTTQRIKRYFATEKLSREYGIELSESDLASIQQNIDSLWSYASEFYEANGVSRSSIEQASVTYSKQNLLMRSIYGEGGERELTDEDYKTYFTENYTRVRYLAFPLYDTTTGEKLSEEDEQKLRDEANAYFERAKKGEAMSDLLIEREKEVTGEEPADTTPGAYDLFLSESSTSPSPAFVEEMRAAAENEPHLIEEETVIYLAMRVDALSDTNYFEKVKPAMLQTIKQDEFDAWLDEEAAAIEISMNDAAVSRYKADKLRLDI